MLVGSREGFEHRHAPKRFGREEFQVFAAQREPEFNVCRSGNTRHERQAHRFRLFDDLWIQPGRHGEGRAAGFGAFEVCDRENGARADDEPGAFFCDFANHFGRCGSAKCDLDHGQTAFDQDIRQRNGEVSLFDRVNRDDSLLGNTIENLF